MMARTIVKEDAVIMGEVLQLTAVTGEFYFSWHEHFLKPLQEPLKFNSRQFAELYFSLEIENEN